LSDSVLSRLERLCGSLRFALERVEFIVEALVLFLDNGKDFFAALDINISVNKSCRIALKA